MTSEEDRAQCPVCFFSVRVNHEGRLVKHVRSFVLDERDICTGSGWIVEK